jgi:hypothetical protein
MVFRRRAMRPSRPGALPFAALFLIALVLASCADARSSRARGPDDRGGWLEVTCRQQQRNCYEEAAQRCPMGYEVARNKGRYDAGNDVPLYSGYMLVRCKAPANSPNADHVADLPVDSAAQVAAGKSSRSRFSVTLRG